MMTSKQKVNVVLDILIIVFASLTILVSVLMTFIILFRQSPTRSDRIAHLLCMNMYISLFIGCAFGLEMYCYTLYGHLHPGVSFDGDWCHYKAYLFYVSGCSFFYSYLLQAVYRLCRIVFYRKQFLQSSVIYFVGIILQWTMSFAQVMPVFLFKTSEYLPNDYHCQIALHNIRGLLIGLALVHMVPISLTTTCYIYTVVHIRRHAQVMKSTRRRACERRDLVVLTRVFLLLTAMIASGLPQLSISIFYQIYGYLPYWSTQFQWLTATFSVFCISVIIIFVSPNLHTFWKKSPSSQNEIYDS
ncbi:unnamed protein product [Adineta ricciae]|uniref:G-protein coupled receptors family 1 profile domain-containing protein n=1 Tax=Adineta ricciae TaxID=249248 RepID=A0A814KD71_ADIRI|nr:unnamed protein product [Adineta ricciae]CAF1494607.1 unnamed protein product [Adineta ricciae]